MKDSIRKLLTLFVLVPLLSPAQVTGDFYSIDTQHSVLDFRARHIGFGGVRGTFSEYDGTIYYDTTDIFKTSASIVIKVESISTGAGGRDGILKEEFFQVKEHPYILFSSSRVLKRGNLYFLVGDLTMGAITRGVEIPFEGIAGPTKDQFSHQRIAVTSNLTLHRMDYQLYYRSNKFWDSIVEDSIKIEIDVGARVYNSLETIFPFRENSIGRIAFEAFQRGGEKEARARVQEVMTKKEEFNTSYSQMMRGATHLQQSGNIPGAIILLDLFMELSPDIPADVKSEFLARKAQYYLLRRDMVRSAEMCKKALGLSKNTLAMEVQKVLFNTSRK